MLRRRGALSAATRTGAGAQLAAHAPVLAARAGTVAAYAGVGTEPPTRALVEALLALGVEVLMPVVRGRVLDWARLDAWSRLGPAPLGLLEPRTAPLGVHAAGAADLVLVPALAVDARGNRIGRGGGYYDRALVHISRERLVAVVYDEDLVAAVPHEPHDRPVGAVLTPRRGLVSLAQ